MRKQEPSYFKDYYQRNKEKWTKYRKTKTEQGYYAKYYQKRKEMLASKRFEIREKIKAEKEACLKALNIRKNYNLFLLKRVMNRQANKKRMASLMDQLEFPFTNKDWILDLDCLQFNMWGFQQEFKQEVSIWKGK